MIQYILIFLSIGISAIAQLLLKLGMTTPSVQDALKSANWPAVAIAMLSNPYLLLGFGLYFSGAVLWLFVLARTDLSIAYPFVALGFLFTAFLSFIILKEQITPHKIYGLLLIIFGVLTISRGA